MHKIKKMKKEIKSVADYLKIINSFDQQHFSQWFYRGVRNENYELIPSLFRYDIKDTLTNWEDLEEYMFKIFCRESLPFLKSVPTDELEWLAIAQHYGLPSKLLDWTINPLIALYFAIERYDRKINSAVWCMGLPSTNNCFPVSTRLDRRVDLEKEQYVMFPNHISPRITNQSGCFTIHELPDGRNPFVPINQEKIMGLFEKLIIKAKYQKKIMDELYEIGIHSGLIYPDLEGLSKKIRYEAFTPHNRCANLDQQERFLKTFD
jgi:hypothetical protein